MSEIDAVVSSHQLGVVYGHLHLHLVGWTVMAIMHDTF
jgi:hypothetical protein